MFPTQHVGRRESVPAFGGRVLHGWLRTAFLIGCLLGAVPVKAQLSGELSGSIGPGTFDVQDTIWVTIGDTLAVQAGTTLNFTGKYPFQIWGTLLAVGTVEDSIVFTADTLTNPGRWRGLDFYAGSSASVLSYCLIENSGTDSTSPDYAGAGVYCITGSPTFSHCTFRNNVSQWMGGGFFCEFGHPVLTSCVIRDNHAQFGGGFYFSHSSPTLTNCIIAGNRAARWGGGIYGNSLSGDVVHCTFAGNAALLGGFEYGGGLYCDNSSCHVNSCIVAHSDGSALFFQNSDSVAVEHCALYGNTSDVEYWSDDTLQGPSDVGILTGVNVNGDSADAFMNVLISPQFVDASAGDYHLAATSHCIGVADSTTGVNSDFDGNPRPNPGGSRPDIGAFEHERATPYVPVGLAGELSDTLGPGFFWVTDSIFVSEGDTLEILPGTTLMFWGPYPFTVLGTLLAAGTADDSIWFTTDPGGNPGLWRGIKFVGMGSSASRLSYCLIENGSATGPDIPSKHGGAVFCDQSNPEFSHCTFRSNAAEWGGGVSCSHSYAQFDGCLFEDNSAGGFGGGVYCWEGIASLVNCVFVRNHAQFGGGAACSRGFTSLSHCTFSHNSVSIRGAGIYLSNTSATVVGCIIAYSAGSGVYFSSSQNAQVRYCDWYGNSGGVIQQAGDTSGHAPAGIGELATLNANDDSCDAYFNVFLPPAFADTLSDDFHLADTSRCIGAAEIGAGPNMDFEGNPRPNPAGSRPDIGAFESHMAPSLPEGLAGSLSGVIGPGTFAIVDTIEVDVEDTLQLQPGTTFEFFGPYPFLILGTLIAEGTAADSIVFMADPLVNPALWRGLRFDSTAGASHLTYCTIERGVATDTGDFAFGGNAYCRYSSPVFEHCTFRHGLAGLGGGLAGRYASPTIRACAFHDNEAISFGGGLYLWFSEAEIENTLVYRNSAVYGGGAYLSDGAPIVEHCTLVENTGTAAIGGIGITWGSAAVINTIVAFSEGSGLSLSHSASALVMNSDVFGNSGGDISFPDDTTEHGPPGLGEIQTVNTNGDSCDGYGNILLNPMLSDTGLADNGLTQWSPCIGAGLVSGATEDFAGDARPSPPGSLPDIGAFEHERDIPLSTTGLIGYLSGEIGPGVLDVLGSIYVQSGRSLRIRPGTTLNFLGPYRFQIEGTLLAEGTDTDSIVFTTDTTANPDRWRGLRFLDNSDSSRLEYCVVEHGWAIGATLEEQRGGGVYCEDSSPTISHSIIRFCSGAWGGGLACWNGSPTVANTHFLADDASSYGGGIYAWQSDVSLSQCLLANCSGGYGGGASVSGGTPVFRQCTLYGNSATHNGGGLHSSLSAPVVNSTIIARSSGAGIYFWDSADAVVSFSDFFGNSAGDFAYSGGDPAQGPDSLAVLTRTNINGDACDKWSNIFLDPEFSDTLASDFSLTESSPSIDAGDSTLPLDPDFTAPDIGAFFYDHGYRPPNAFGLWSPQWGDTNWTMNATLTWEVATDSEPMDTVRYDVWLDTTSSLSGAWAIALDLADTSCAAAGLFDDHEYYWTVAAKDLRGLTTPATDTLMFRTYVPEPPESFALAEPANLDTLFTLTPTLKWHATGDPDPGDSVCYRVVWSYREDFAAVEDTLVCDTSVTLSEGVLIFRPAQQKQTVAKAEKRKGAARVLDDVEDDSTVYWKVEAVDRFGLATWCEPQAGWRFVVYIEQAPDSFDLLQPSDQDTLDTLNVVFRWNETRDPDAGDGIAFYRLYLSRDPDFLGGVDSLTTADTSATLSVDDDEEYWWCVRAFDTHGHSTVSRQTRSFHTYWNEPPHDFALAAPENGDTLNTTTPTLRWCASSDPDPGDTACYRLYWSFDADFTSAEDTALCDTFFVFPQGLLCQRGSVFTRRAHDVRGRSLDEIPDDSTVYWKVESRDRTGRTAWCIPQSGWHFSVYVPQAPLGFDLIAPVHGSVVDTPVVELQWETAIDPDPGDSVVNYRVYLAHDSLFTVGADSEDVAQTHLWWAGLDDDMTFWWRVRAFDTQGLSALSSQQWRFQTYICEAPNPFDLVTPPDSAEVEGETQFCWRACLDPDPNDTVTYTLHFQSGDSLLEYATGSDTCLSVDLTETTLAGFLVIEWWVSARSLCPDAVMESASRFHVFLPSQVSEQGATIPTRYELYQNYPNPFNPATTIRFDLPATARVELHVFNTLGQCVATLKNGALPPGVYRVTWDGMNASGVPAAPGVYIYRIRADGFTAARKMLLIR